MSWNSIKNKNIPYSKRNLTTVTAAVNEVAAMSQHAPYLLQIGKQVLITTTISLLLLAATSYTYEQMTEDQEEKIYMNQIMKQRLRELLRAFCVALDG